MYYVAMLGFYACTEPMLFFSNNKTIMIEEHYHPWTPNSYCAKNPEITVSIIYNELCLCLNTVTQGKVKCDPNPSYELVSLDRNPSYEVVSVDPDPTYEVV